MGILDTELKKQSNNKIIYPPDFPLLRSPQICHYCKKDPGHAKNNKYVWAGFLDKDLKIFVCMNCREKHYKAKSKTESKNLYTEFPVVMWQPYGKLLIERT